MFPATLVTDRKEQFLCFIDKHKKVITKPLQNHINAHAETHFLSSTGTRLVTLENIEVLDEYFMPAILQAYVEKEVEIRVFFFKDKFFRNGHIFSNDSKTATDYRNYNDEKPNRVVPFMLPNHILEKLITFSQKANIDTGSFD